MKKGPGESFFFEFTLFSEDLLLRKNNNPELRNLPDIFRESQKTQGSH